MHEELAGVVDDVVYLILRHGRAGLYIVKLHTQILKKVRLHLNTHDLVDVVLGYEHLKNPCKQPNHMLSLELMDLLHQWTMKRRQERKQDPPRIVILRLHHRKNGHVLPHYVQNLGRLDVKASLVCNLILHASDEVENPLEEVLEDMDEQLSVVRTWLL